MALINKGDLLLVLATNDKVVATTDDYDRRFGGTDPDGCVNDWVVIPGVEAINPSTGKVGWYRLSNVRQVTN